MVVRSRHLESIQNFFQAFHVVSLLDLSFPPQKGGMMHHGGAAASGTTTAGGVLFFWCGEDEPTIFSQFYIVQEMASLEMDTISPKIHGEANKKIGYFFLETLKSPFRLTISKKSNEFSP